MSNALIDFYKYAGEVVVTTEKNHQEPELSGPGRSAFNGLPLDIRSVDDLRLERYGKKAVTGTGAILTSELAQRLYYALRFALSSSLRRRVQRFGLRDWNCIAFPRWPVDTSVEEILERQLLETMRSRGVDSIPFVWFWPGGAHSAAVMTHDVETSAGMALVPSLIDVDDEFEIKASYQLVPERRYVISNQLLEVIRARQCEVNVHGLDHHGNLFRDRNTFLNQSKQINRYVESFGAEGFRAGSMYRNVEWLNELNISYDMSVPNVAHLEPQRGGCCTVFPYFAGKVLEIPLTTIQDYSLLHILGDYSIELWKKQIELVTTKHGLVSFIVHPDYILTKNALPVYRSLLAHLSRLRNELNVWIALPGGVNRWWRERNAMSVARDEDGNWRIEGRGRERARIAFARIRNNRIEYAMGQSYEQPAHSFQSDDSWREAQSIAMSRSMTSSIVTPAGRLG